MSWHLVCKTKSESDTGLAIKEIAVFYLSKTFKISSNGAWIHFNVILKHADKHRTH